MLLIAVKYTNNSNFISFNPLTLFLKAKPAAIMATTAAAAASHIKVETAVAVRPLPAALFACSSTSSGQSSSVGAEVGLLS